MILENNRTLLKSLSIFRNKKNVNPWHYSSKERRPTEAVPARWRCRGLVVSKASSLNFKFSFLNRISLLLNELVTLLSSRAWLDPVQNLETVLGYSQDLIRDLMDSIRRANRYTEEEVIFAL